jgi:hypothetical protein
VWWASSSRLGAQAACQTANEHSEMVERREKEERRGWLRLPLTHSLKSLLERLSRVSTTL